MKKYLVALAGMLMVATSYSQSVMHLTSGENLFVRSGEKVSFAGLVITPSSDYTLTTNTITVNASVQKPALNPQDAVQRTYNFSSPTLPFTGALRMYYADGELNGIPENELIVNIQDGNHWNPIPATSTDLVGNFVELNPVTGLALHEIAFTSSNAILPLQWGNVSAKRQGKDLSLAFTIYQGYSLSHFDVERMDIPASATNSAARMKWEKVIAAIPAYHSSKEHTYSAIDKDAPASSLAYRIKQTDADGKYSYSMVVSVAAAMTRTIALFPNPATTFFRIQADETEKIKSVTLINAGGSEVKKFVSMQTSYAVSDLPSGIYQVVILFEGGKKIVMPLMK